MVPNSSFSKNLENYQDFDYILANDNLEEVKNKGVDILLNSAKIVFILSF